MIRKSKYFLIIAIVVLGMFFTGFVNKTIWPQERTEGYDKVVESNLSRYMNSVEKNGFSGTILVAKDGHLLLDKGYGMADFNMHIANEPKDVFEIGSLTKQFTATAILMLQEKGLLNVQDEVNKYIPSFPDGDKIRLYNLLTHTSEIPVGTKFKYSNTNYILLGHIIEKVSGMKYEDYIEKNIIKPLQLKDTGFISSQAALKDEAVGYSNTGEQANKYIRMVGPKDQLLYSAAGIYSTVQDLYSLNDALFTDRLISKKSLNEMLTPYLNDYGFAWFIKKCDDGSKIIYHGGSIAGYSSVIERNIDKKDVVIILSNRFNENKDINSIASETFKILDMKG